jgi:hypothetical protein
MRDGSNEQYHAMAKRCGRSAAAEKDTTSEVMAGNTGEKIKRLLSIDGKTQRGNGTAEQAANRIVSAVDEDGFCVAEALVADKSNEITAIPELLGCLNIQGNIITTDASD